MSALRRILVPIDFSAGSRQAVRYAVELAERFGAGVEALHVWEPSPYVAPTQLVWIGGDTRTFWQHMSQELDGELRQLLRQEAPGAFERIEAKVVAGYVSHAILQRLEAQPAIDLVVMATHGRTGLAHALIGSVAERVVRHAPCPVLTLRVPGKGADARADKDKRRTPSDRPAPRP